MPTPATHADARARASSSASSAGTPQDVPRLAEIYVDDARFKDPFNEVQGVAAITRIFEHMFATLDAPRFVIHDVIVQGDQCFLTWDFRFRMKRFAATSRPSAAART
jgi:steroid delta-isomerase